MSKLLKLSGWLAVGILGSLIAYYLVESSLLAPLKQHNPIDTATKWLSSSVAIPRILWLSAVVWSLVTLPFAIGNLWREHIYVGRMFVKIDALESGRIKVTDLTDEERGFIKLHRPEYFKYEG
jgi:hypothetical protein